jgi:hypothetical protein
MQRKTNTVSYRWLLDIVAFFMLDSVTFDADLPMIVSVGASYTGIER